MLAHRSSSIHCVCSSFASSWRGTRRGEPIDRVIPGMVVGQRVAVVAGAGLEHLRDVTVDLARDRLGSATRCFAIGQVAPTGLTADPGRLLFRCAEPIGEAGCADADCEHDRADEEEADHERKHSLRHVVVAEAIDDPPHAGKLRNPLNKSDPFSPRCAGGELLRASRRPVRRRRRRGGRCPCRCWGGREC